MLSTVLGVVMSGSSRELPMPSLILHSPPNILARIRNQGSLFLEALQTSLFLPLSLMVTVLLPASPTFRLYVAPLSVPCCMADVVFALVFYCQGLRTSRGCPKGSLLPSRGPAPPGNCCSCRLHHRQDINFRYEILAGETLWIRRGATKASSSHRCRRGADNLGTSSHTSPSQA